MSKWKMHRLPSPPPPQMATNLMHPMAKTTPPAIAEAATIRAATVATVTRTAPVTAAETANVAIGPATTTAAAAARPNPPEPRAARPAATEARGAAAAAVMTNETEIETATLAAAEVVAAMAITTGVDGAAAADARGPGRLVVAFIVRGMIAGTTVIGAIGGVERTNNVVVGAAPLGRIDLNARRRLLRLPRTSVIAAPFSSSNLQLV